MTVRKRRRSRRSETSKKLLYIHVAISVTLCVTTIVGTFIGIDVTNVEILAAASLITDGAWGGFYFWKSKNENRAKYAQQFLVKFAEKYGAEVALRAAEIVLKD